MLPTISVVIPLFNAEPWISDTVGSILRQTLLPTEILVVNDGSTDLSAHVCRRLSDKSSIPIRVISQRNQGQAHSRNRGVENARSEYVAFLDSDDIWLPRKLEKQVELMTRLQLEAVTCGYIHWRPGHWKPLGSYQFDWSGKRIRQWSLGYGIGAALASTLVIKVESFRQMGGFREDMSIFTDLDFSMRLFRRRSVEAVLEPLVAYRQHSIQIHRQNDKLIPEAKFFADAVLSSREATTLQRSILVLSALRLLRRGRFSEARALSTESSRLFWLQSAHFVLRRSMSRFSTRRLVKKRIFMYLESWNDRSENCHGPDSTT